jgi:hypothetical protein
MKEQQVIFTITNSGDGHNLKISFEPGLHGPESEEYEDMNDDEKQMQGFASHVASEVMKALKD